MNFTHISAGPGATQIIQLKADGMFLLDKDSLGELSLSGEWLAHMATADLQPIIFRTSNYVAYKNINPERVPETCVWLLEHPTFQKWRASSGDDLLWLSADPGCGKSVLSRALIDEKLVGAESVTLCYFFFKDNDEQNNTATALCALLHQLFCAHDGLLQKHAASAVKKCRQALTNNFEELWRVFISVAMDPSAGDVICILDALDECQQPDRDKLITYLERFYSRSFDKLNRGSKLKFLVTSRPYVEIERRFSKLTRDVPTVRLAGEEESEKISYEIGIVLEAKVKEITERRRLREDVGSSLHRRLRAIPNRTYLWLRLTLDEVERALVNTEKKLLKVIDTLPSTVEEAYEKILARCVREEAGRVLQIIVAAQRPLTVSEIDVALEIGPDSTSYGGLDLRGYGNRKEWIRKSCGLFVSIVGTRVHLIHQTAREFLVQKNNEMSGPQVWRHSVNLQKAHQVLAEMCVTHLLFREFQEYRTPTDADESYILNRVRVVQAYAEKYAFLDYSANNWMFHVQEAHMNSSTWVSRTAQLCDIGDGSSCAWFSIYSTSTPLPYTPYRQSKQSALYWAAVFGLVNTTQFLLDGGSNPHTQGGYFGNTLQAASAGGHEQIVKLLLDKGAYVNAKGGKYGNALQAASAGGHDQIVQRLLEKGADVNAQFSGFSALSVATINRNKLVMEILFAAGASIEAALKTLESLDAQSPNLETGKFLRQTAICYAAAAANEKMVKELIDAGADVNGPSEPDLKAPLHFAAESGRINVVRALLAANADPTKEDELGRTAYEYAEKAGSQSEVEEIKREIELFNKEFRLALYYTIAGGRTEVKWVEITRRTMDHILFSQILNIYKKARRKGWWQYSLKGFRGVSFVEGTITSHEGSTRVTTEDCAPKSKLLRDGTVELHHQIWNPPKGGSSERIWAKTFWDEISDRSHSEPSRSGLRCVEGWVIRRIKILAVICLLLAGLIGLLWASLLKKTEAGFAITACLIAAESLVVALMVFESQLRPANS